MKEIHVKAGDVLKIVCDGQQENVQQDHVLKEKGDLKYKVGLIGDTHIDRDDPKRSECRADLINALQFFFNEGVDFISNLGDICEYEPDDYRIFSDIYTNYAWSPSKTQLRLFTAIGNHDYWLLYSKNSDIAGLLPCFCDFTGEDLWKNYGYKNKEDYIQFFEYDGAWDKQKYGERTVKSKLSYWLENKGDIWIYLAIDYGEDTGEVWDEQIRGYHMLDKRDKYVQQMIDYVSDTNYKRENGSFDYQFYNPNALIWLHDILENTRGQRKILNLHHFLPHKAGDSDGIYSRLRIWPYSTSEAVRQKYYYGSNTLCGLTFWYIDKLTNEFKDDLIVISGHDHREWNDFTSVCRHDYVVRKPTGLEATPLTDNLESLKGTEYDYRLYIRESEEPCGESAVTIGLPSLSKPISVDGQTLYGASQGGIMEVYENCVVIKCIEFKKQGDEGYQNKVIKEIVI